MTKKNQEQDALALLPYESPSLDVIYLSRPNNLLVSLSIETEFEDFEEEENL